MEPNGVVPGRPSQVLQLGAAPYGRLLLAKLAVFVGMVGLAAANRYRLTPGLAKGLAQGDPASALHALRLSLLVETAAGLVVLLLVSMLGVLAPVAAQQPVDDGRGAGADTLPNKPVSAAELVGALQGQLLAAASERAAEDLSSSTARAG
jgi:hypothetical protein